uniref:Fibronectin type-III domain-containing protein n=1 Tax=Heterorhabditis bacteriophora TaxID=37862 RepID=A0A1I7XN95_HETBA
MNNNKEEERYMSQGTSTAVTWSPPRGVTIIAVIDGSSSVRTDWDGKEIPAYVVPLGGSPEVYMPGSL